ncbi:hypothetical protein AGMMS49928_14380 [Spirochaetia bacterium]|nr:hypothetical protein AGMMS49928_14380 [Spirochaetia bacterium]
MADKIEFIHGIDLCRGFYHDVVKPLLQKFSPELNYSSSLIGYGSDVMGFDTATSMDHNWGPRMQIFVDDKSKITEIDNYLCRELPALYKNFPVNFSEPAYDKVQRMERPGKNEINHLIEIVVFEDYLKTRYAMDKISNFTLHDWLAFKDQSLIEITGGEVFHDGLGKLNKAREELKFYPDEICKLRLAVLWHYISNKEAFIGRSRELGDITGLKIQAGRIVNYLIKILFYLEKKYIPYSKWFGSAFKQLESYSAAGKLAEEILCENDPAAIEEKLCDFYTLVIEDHNKTPGMPRLKNTVRNYHNRPYRVIFSENIMGELLGGIEDEEVKNTNLRAYAHDIILDE